MITEIQGKTIKGYSYADGVHWHWGDKEIAIINESTNEIEWLDRLSNIPNEVVDIIRNKRNKPIGKWIIEVRRVDISYTQHEFEVWINDECVASFGDGSGLGEPYKSDDPKLNENPGKYVYATFWHKLDDVYHISDKAKDIFKPDWKN